MVDDRKPTPKLLGEVLRVIIVEPIVPEPDIDESSSPPTDPNG